MKDLSLQKKLMVFISSLVILIIFISSIITYASLNKAYNRVIEVTNEKMDLLIKTQVECMVEVLRVNHQRFLDGEITEDEAVEEAKKIVRNSRYNNGVGYFWADMSDGTSAVHIKPDVEGTNRYNTQDAQGNYFVQDTIAAGNVQGGDYIDFYFAKPGETEASAKRGFVKKFEPYDWHIGTGNYKDDMQVLVEDELNKCSREKFWAMIVTIISGVILAMISIVFMSYISKSIAKPIKDCAIRLRMLSEGDLKSDVVVSETEDEIGILTKATKGIVDTLKSLVNEMSSILNEMSKGNLNISCTGNYERDLFPLKQSTLEIINSLNMTISQINRTSKQVSEGSGQVSSVSQALAEGATDQASSIQELSASITEISEQVKTNANSSVDATDLSNTVLKKVEDSNEQMKTLIDAMSEISRSSNEINNIIRAIDDIASQTNLLALNAAIEAARAGENGKGFAVVAEEVRKLASKSTEAVKDTTNLIQVSINAVENGMNITNKTAQSLESIVDSTRETASLINKISEASNFQSSSISQITQAIEQISDVVQTNSATAQESAATSESLNSQAQVLEELVNRFDFKDINI